VLSAKSGLLGTPGLARMLCALRASGSALRPAREGPRIKVTAPCPFD
jgi:hypothetical protein